MEIKQLLIKDFLIQSELVYGAEMQENEIQRIKKSILWVPSNMPNYTAVFKIAEVHYKN